MSHIPPLDPMVAARKGFRESEDRLKRFWKTVDVAEVEGGWRVLLDGRAPKTPGGAPYDLPTEAVARLAARLETQESQSAILLRIAEGQDRVAAALTGEAGSPHIDAESRMRLRSIDTQMLRLLEEVAAGRQEALGDLRADLAQLTRAVRSLGGRADPPPGRG